MKPETFPFISFDMPNEDYHRGEWQADFLSSTTMKRYLVSPKYYLYCKEHPEADNISLEASMKGSVYHSLLASLTNKGDYSDFEQEYFVFEPPINPKTGAAYGISTQKYMEAYEEAKTAHPGQEATSVAEVAQAKAMVGALLHDCGSTSRSVNELIKWGNAEVSHFCMYQGHGFKFRTDLITGRKIVDWKTISADDLHVSTIQAQIRKCHYGLSAAFYQFFAHEVTGRWYDFFWVFQQKTAPYDAVLVSAQEYAYHYNEDQDYLQRGPDAQLFEELLRQHLTCCNTGYFPGAEVFLMPEAGNRRIMYAREKYPEIVTFWNE